jgi:RNA polymerase sigma-70 factor, ECF subfamily
VCARRGARGGCARDRRQPPLALGCRYVTRADYRWRSRISHHERAQLADNCEQLDLACCEAVYQTPGNLDRTPCLAAKRQRNAGNGTERSGDTAIECRSLQMNDFTAAQHPFQNGPLKRRCAVGHGASLSNQLGLTGSPAQDDRCMVGGDNREHLVEHRIEYVIKRRDTSGGRTAQEAHRARTDLDAVTLAQRYLANATAIEECSPSAPQVGQHELVGPILDGTVLGRHACVLESQVAAAASTNQQPVPDLDGPLGRAALFHDQRPAVRGHRSASIRGRPGSDQPHTLTRHVHGTASVDIARASGLYCRIEHTGDVTGLLTEWRGGRVEAMDELVPLVYRELQRLARHYLRREQRSPSIGATTLVHEAYLRLVQQPSPDWQNRAHFFGIAARLMRQILVDRARAKLALKRQGNAEPLSLDELPLLSALPDERLLVLDAALQRLAAIDAQQVRIVELRFFGGLTLEETAVALAISPATVSRDWAVAKAWLYAEVHGQ